MTPSETLLLFVAVDITSPDIDTVTETRVAIATPGGRAREIIRRKGFRMTWVAEQLGITPSLLSRRLAGNRSWPEPFAGALAEVLGVTLWEISG